MIICIFLFFICFFTGLISYSFDQYSIFSWLNVYAITVAGNFPTIGDVIKCNDGNLYIVFDVLTNSSKFPLYTLMCYKDPTFKYKPLNNIIIKIIKINYKLHTQK